MVVSRQAGRPVVLAGGTGALFGLVELAFAPATQPSVGVTALDVGLGVVGLALGHALLAWFGRRLGSRAPLVPVLAWSLIWGPELAREAALWVGLGAIPALALLAVGWWRPRVAVVACLLGALPWAAAGPALATCGACQDVVLVTVDTVRADAGLLAAAGADNDEWRTGRAIAAAPWTPPAMHSIFLGEPVSVHGAGVDSPDGVSGRAPGAEGLVEALRTRGYRAAAFVGNPHLRPSAGFARGFSTWSHVARAPAPLLVLRSGRLALRRWLRRSPPSTTIDAELIMAARRWLAGSRPGARFLWLHLMGPHAWTREDPRGAPVVDDSPAARRERYAGHVEVVGRALRGLWTDVPADALVILMSDHGELLGEDGTWGHGRSLSPVLLETPIAIRGPRVPAEPETVRATSIRSAVLSWADGGDARLAVGEGARLGGVRGAPTVAGVWRQGSVRSSSVEAAPGVVPAPLEPAERTALEQLGYLDAGEGSPEP